MKLKTILRHLDDLLKDKNKQLGHLRSPEAKLFLEGQIAVLNQIKKEIKKDQK